MAIRRFVRTYTRTLVHSYTSAGQEPAGKAHLDRDQVYRTRQVLDRQGFLCVQVSARPQVESGHFGGNNVEQHLLTLIFGRILTLLKHHLQCISACAVAYSGLALQLCP